ncbi:MAG: hypothetical protein M1825_005302 [Sarcosagium campestre]|nr:MAG: hypothetical protein M1825_005302 [Sarcosagium campestre]
MSSHTLPPDSPPPDDHPSDSLPERSTPPSSSGSCPHSQATSDSCDSQYRPAGQSRRVVRTYVDHDVFDGLPVRHWQRQEVTVCPPQMVSEVSYTRNFQTELPMPDDAYLLCPMSQALLQAARAGRLNKRAAPPEPDTKDAPIETEAKRRMTEKSYTAVKWQLVPRHLERPDEDCLAKRRKGLRPLSLQTIPMASQSGGPLKPIRIGPVDADGNVLPPGYAASADGGVGGAGGAGAAGLDGLGEGDGDSDGGPAEPGSSNAAKADGGKGGYFADAATAQTTPPRGGRGFPPRRKRGQGRGRRRKFTYIKARDVYENERAAANEEQNRSSHPGDLDSIGGGVTRDASLLGNESVDLGDDSLQHDDDEDDDHDDDGDGDSEGDEGDEGEVKGEEAEDRDQVEAVRQPAPVEVKEDQATLDQVANTVQVEAAQVKGPSGERLAGAAPEIGPATTINMLPPKPSAPAATDTADSPAAETLPRDEISVAKATENVRPSASAEPTEATLDPLPKIETPGTGSSFSSAPPTSADEASVVPRGDSGQADKPTEREMREQGPTIGGSDSISTSTFAAAPAVAVASLSQSAPILPSGPVIESAPAPDPRAASASVSAAAALPSSSVDDQNGSPEYEPPSPSALGAPAPSFTTEPKDLKELPLMPDSFAAFPRRPRDFDLPRSATTHPLPPRPGAPGNNPP